MQPRTLDHRQIRVYTLPNRRPRRSGSRMPIVGVFLCCVLTSLIVFGCVPASGPTPNYERADSEIVPTNTPEAPDFVPTATATQPAQPTQTPLSCLARGGTIEVHEIRHPDFVSPIRTRVFLPPCYARDTLATYPTLILLHGLLATDEQWGELGVFRLADQLISSGQSPPFIMLMPWIRNSQDPRIAVMEAVLPYARERWRLSDERQFQAIGGISRGAGQALQIGLLNPDQFGAVGLHSPAILHSPELLLTWYLGITPAQQPRIWLDIGESDSLYATTQILIDLFQDAGVKIEQHIYPGDHTPEYWEEHLSTYLAWYRSFWLTPNSMEVER